MKIFWFIKFETKPLCIRFDKQMYLLEIMMEIDT